MSYFLSVCSYVLTSLNVAGRDRSCSRLLRATDSRVPVRSDYRNNSGVTQRELWELCRDGK